VLGTVLCRGANCQRLGTIVYGVYAEYLDGLATVNAKLEDLSSYVIDGC
jgi:hypothetical protein